MTQSTLTTATSSLSQPIPVTNRRHGRRSIMQQFAVALAIVVSCQILPFQAHADIVSTFDTNLEGWTQFQNSGPNFDWVASGGNPAGHLGATDNTSDWAYVQAPSTFLTPVQYNGTFSFDLKHDNLQEPPGFPGILTCVSVCRGPD